MSNASSDILNGFEKTHIAKDAFVTKFDKHATVIDKQSAHASLVLEKRNKDLLKDNAKENVVQTKNAAVTTGKSLKKQVYDSVAQEGYVADKFGDDASDVMDDAKLGHDRTYSAYQFASKVFNAPQNHRKAQIAKYERKELKALKQSQKKLNEAKALYAQANNAQAAQTQFVKTKADLGGKAGFTDKANLGFQTQAQGNVRFGKFSSFNRTDRLNAGKQAKLSKKADKKLASARKKAGKTEKYIEKQATKGVKNAKHSLLKSIFSGSRGGFLKFIAAFGGTFLLIVGAAAVTTMLVAVLASAMAASVGNTGNLSGVQAQVAMYLRQKGFSDAAIAGIMGNMDNEGSWDPGTNEQGGGGFGLFQFDGDNKTNFFAYCTANNLSPTDVTVQLDFVFNHPTEEIISSWGTTLYETGFYDDLIGVGGWDGTIYGDKNDFKTASDVVNATASFMACYERCQSGETSHFDRRVESAQNFYLQLISGSIFSGGATTEEGQRIVDACYTTPTTKEGACAMWVSDVIENAGFTRPGGDACNFYWNYCTSDNIADLKPGMVIAVPSNSSGYMGETYGHVGIYIGDGNVISSVGYIRTESLDSFRSWNETNGFKCKWGWAI